MIVLSAHCRVAEGERAWVAVLDAVFQSATQHNKFSKDVKALTEPLVALSTEQSELPQTIFDEVGERVTPVRCEAADA